MNNLNNLTMVNLDDYNGEIDWRANLYDDDVYLFIAEGQVLAEAVLFDRYDSIYIDNIETKYFRKGIGIHTIKAISEYAIKKGKSKLSGGSIIDALRFWDYFCANFKFQEDDTCDKEDELIPFTIKCCDVQYAYNQYIKRHS